MHGYRNRYRNGYHRSDRKPLGCAQRQLGRRSGRVVLHPDGIMPKSVRTDGSLTNQPDTFACVMEAVAEVVGVLDLDSSAPSFSHLVGQVAAFNSTAAVFY